MAPLIESNYQDAAARLTDLEALVQASTSAARLSEVAAEHALEPPSGTSDLAGPPVIDEDYMVISTVHSAKGLEWDAVHVIHAADGNPPIWHCPTRLAWKRNAGSSTWPHKGRGEASMCTCRFGFM